MVDLLDIIGNCSLDTRTYALHPFQLNLIQGIKDRTRDFNPGQSRSQVVNSFIERA